jgi:hypothetical protein
MRTLLVVILLLVPFESCVTETVDPLSIEGKLVTRIKATCSDSSNCTIRLKDVTAFTWDRVYVFNYAARQSEIEKVIGAPFPPYEEFKRSMIFLNGGTVVYSEVEATDIESPINNQVIFDVTDRGAYRSYSSESQFEVKRKQLRGDTYYYELKLIESSPAFTPQDLQD